jgi:hypothetical protein
MKAHPRELAREVPKLFLVGLQCARLGSPALLLNKNVSETCPEIRDLGLTAPGISP